MPTNIDDEIRAKTETFAKDLSVLVRRLALEVVTTALGGKGAAVAVAAPTAAKRGRGRPRKAAAPAPAAAVPAAKPAGGRTAAKGTKAAPAAKAPAPKKAATPKRAAGEKRPAAELAKLIEGLDEYIKAHPGARMDALSKALATPAKDLRFPAVKLVRAKKVRTEGQRQHMAYFPA